MEVGGAHPVDHDGHAAEVVDRVAVEVALVEEQLVAQSRAATGLDRDTQLEVVATLLVEQRLDLRAGVSVNRTPSTVGRVVVDWS